MKQVTFNRMVKAMPHRGLLPRFSLTEGYELYSTFHPGRKFVVAKTYSSSFLTGEEVNHPTKWWCLYLAEPGCSIEKEMVRATTRKQCIEKSLVLLAGTPPEKINEWIASVLKRRAKVFLSL